MPYFILLDVAGRQIAQLATNKKKLSPRGVIFSQRRDFLVGVVAQAGGGAVCGPLPWSLPRARDATPPIPPPRPPSQSMTDLIRAAPGLKNFYLLRIHNLPPVLVCLKAADAI